MPELLSSIAQLLWPLITLAVLLVFRRAIGRVLRTAERRELEVEVGGQRLTMHQLNDQQNEMIQDLQRQLSTLSKQLEQSREQAPEVAQAPSSPEAPREPTPAEPGERGSPQPTAPPSFGGEHPVPPAQQGPSEDVLAGDARHSRHPDSPGRPAPETSDPGTPDVSDGGLPSVHMRAPTGPEPFAVLWVAERPESHALLVQQLRDNGVRVTTATTTTEALEHVSRRPYRLIVSDMARTENGHFRSDAGIGLLRELRDLGVDIPVIVFSGHREQLQNSGLARQSGAVATTTSAYEMFQHFQNFGLL